MVKSIWFDRRFLSLPQTEQNKVLSGQLDLETIPWPEDAQIERATVREPVLAGETPSGSKGLWETVNPEGYRKATGLAESFGSEAIGGGARDVGSTLGMVSDFPAVTMTTDPNRFLLSKPLKSRYETLMKKPQLTEEDLNELKQIEQFLGPEELASTSAFPKSDFARGMEQVGTGLMDAGQARAQEARNIREQAGIAEDSILGYVSKAGSSVPSMAAGVGASLINPVFGAGVMGAATVGNEYQQNISEGMGGSAALAASAPMAAAEVIAERFGLGALTKSGLDDLVKKGFVSKAIADQVEKNVLTKVAGAGAINTAEELATNEIQMAFEEDVLGRKLTPEEKSERRWQSAVAGGALGSAARAGTAIPEMFTGDPGIDAGIQSAAEIQKKAEADVKAMVEGKAPEATPEVTPVAEPPGATPEQRAAIFENLPQVPEERVKREIDAAYETQLKQQEAARKQQEEVAFDQMQEQRLIDDVAKAEASGDLIAVAKAEKALDTFYKTPRKEAAPVEMPPALPTREQEQAQNRERATALESTISTLEARQKRAKKPERIADLQSKIDSARQELNTLRPQPTVTGGIEDAQAIRGDQGQADQAGSADRKGQGISGPNLQQQESTGVQPSEPSPQEEVTLPTEGVVEFEDGPASPEQIALATRAVNAASKTQETQVREEQKASKVAGVQKTLEDRGIKGVKVFYDDTVGKDNTVQAGRMNTGTADVEVNAFALDDPADVVAVAVHEVTHALSTAKDQGGVSRKDIGRILGTENRARVNAQLQVLATSSPVVRRAIEKAKKSDNPEVEMLTYAVEEIRLAREKGENPGYRVMTFIRDLVASFKGTLARMGLKDLAKDFNEADLYRLGKVALKEYSKGTRPLPVGKGGQVLESRRAAPTKLAERALGEPARNEGKTVATKRQEETPRVSKASFSTVPGRPLSSLPPELRAIQEQRKVVVAQTEAAQAAFRLADAISKQKKGQAMPAQRAVDAVSEANEKINELMDSNITLRNVLDKINSAEDEAAARAKVTRQRDKDALAKYDTLVREKQARLKELRDKYPDVFSEYMIATGKVQKFSLEMMNAMLESGRALSSLEANQILKIRRQFNTYVTRQFRAYAGDYRVAKSWKDALLKAYKQYKKTGVHSELSKIFVDAMDDVKTRYLDIGSFIETVEGSPEAKASRPLSMDDMYKWAAAWIPRDKLEEPKAGMTPDERDAWVEGLTKELKARKKQLQDAGLYDDRLKSKSERLVKEILGVLNTEADSFASLLVGGLRNSASILKQKQDISKPIRKLLGEITDPVYQIQSTLAAQASWLAKRDTQDQIYDVLKEKGLLVDESEKDVHPDLTEALKGTETYGKLAGMYTTPEIAALLKAKEEMEVPTTGKVLDAAWGNLSNATIRAINKRFGTKIEQAEGVPSLGGVGGVGNWMLQEVWMKAAGFSQKAKVIYNFLISVPTNFLGSVTQVAATNGIIYNPFSKSDRRAMAKAIRATMGTFAPERRAMYDQFAKEVTKVSLDDSANIAETQDIVRSRRAKQIMRDAIGQSESRIQKAFDLVSSGALRVDEALVWMVASSDKTMVYYAYFKEKEYLTDYFNALGETKTEEQIELEAAERIKISNITPSRAPEAVKAVQKIGLQAYFRFFSETFRIYPAAFQLGTNDITEGKKMMKSKDAGERKAGRMRLMKGTKRALGALAGVVGHRAALQAAISGSLLYGLSSIFTGGGEDDEEKSMKQVNGFALTQGLGDRDKSYVLIGKADDGSLYFTDAGRVEAAETGTAPMLALIAQQNPEKALAQVEGLLFASPFTGAVARNAADWKGSEKLAVDVAKAFSPAWLNNLADPRIDLRDKKVPTEVKLAIAAGAYVQEVQPNDIFKYQWYKEVGKSVKDQKKEVYEFLDKQDPEDFDSKAFEKMVIDSRIKEQGLLTRAQEMVKGAKMMGFSDENIQASLKAQSVNTTVAEHLLSGNDIDGLILNESVLESKKNELVRKASNQAQISRIESQYDKAIKLLYNIDSKINRL